MGVISTIGVGGTADGTRSSATPPSPRDACLGASADAGAPRLRAARRQELPDRCRFVAWRLGNARRLLHEGDLSDEPMAEATLTPNEWHSLVRYLRLFPKDSEMARLSETIGPKLDPDGGLSGLTLELAKEDARLVRLARLSPDAVRTNRAAAGTGPRSVRAHWMRP